MKICGYQQRSGELMESGLKMNLLGDISAKRREQRA